MKSYPRARKVDEALKEALAEIVLRDLKDPRLELVTVTDVRTSTDMKHADVYVIAYGGEERYRSMLDGLAAAKGRIRHVLSHRLDMKYIPDLVFKVDDSVDEGMHILEVLRREEAAGRGPRPEGSATGDEGADS